MIILLFSSLIIFIDQLSKFIIRNMLLEGESIEIITNILSLKYLKNRGAAFGILEGQRYFFIIITFLFFIFILYLYISELKKNKITDIIIIFLLGGSISNLIDRILFTYVTDFIAVYNFPVINFADIFISLGVVLLMYQLIEIEK
ncbi:MAG: signal peptidase II [Halanaerobium sp.]